MLPKRDKPYKSHYRPLILVYLFMLAFYSYLYTVTPDSTTKNIITFTFLPLITIMFTNAYQRHMDTYLFVDLRLISNLVNLQTQYPIWLTDIKQGDICKKDKPFLGPSKNLQVVEVSNIGTSTISSLDIIFNSLHSTKLQITQYSIRYPLLQGGKLYVVAPAGMLIHDITLILHANGPDSAIQFSGELIQDGISQIFSTIGLAKRPVQSRLGKHKKSREQIIHCSRTSLTQLNKHDQADNIQKQENCAQQSKPRPTLPDN